MDSQNRSVNKDNVRNSHNDKPAQFNYPDVTVVLKVTYEWKIAAVNWSCEADPSNLFLLN